MAGGLIKKYRWHLIAIVAVYAAISLWLFFSTDSQQEIHFVYEVF